MRPLESTKRTRTIGPPPDQIVFPAVDPVTMAKVLDVPHRAATVRPPQPMPSAGSLDPNEETFQRCHRSLVVTANGLAGEALAAAGARQSELSATLAKDFANAGKLAQDDLDRHKIASKDVIVAQAGVVEGIEREKRQFQLDHRLAREPREGEPAGKVIFGFFLAVLLEGFFNMHALAAGLRGGLLEGLLTATVLAAANLAAGFAAGFAVREILHTQTPRKVVGWLALAVYLTALCHWSALLGYYRELLIQHPDTASTMAVQALLQYGVFGSFVSVQGIVLVLVTMGFGLAAMLSVFLTRDPYPGYARLGAQLAPARAAYAAVRSDYLTGIDAVKDGCVEALMAERDEWHAARAALRQHVADLWAVVTSYEHFLDKVRLSVQEVCGQYRRVLGILSGQPVPVFAGPLDVGEEIDLTACKNRMRKIEENLDDPGGSVDLECKVAAAQTAILDATAAARNDAHAFFAACGAGARGTPVPASTTVAGLLPAFHPVP